VTDKQRYPRYEALAIADELVAMLLPFCDRIAIAGSLRRRKPDVGDIEILYIPTVENRSELLTRPSDLFADSDPIKTRDITVNLVDEKLDELVAADVLERRKNALGREVYGEKNKLMRHIPSGIPVDLFAATAENWFSLLVCRTGSAESNTRICMAAQSMVFKWKPYEGIVDELGNLHSITSERELFLLVGLPYLEPWERV
jgi:DNA polymerase/3'-5' exonuclease PolX